MAKNFTFQPEFNSEGLGFQPDLDPANLTFQPRFNPVTVVHSGGSTITIDDTLTQQGAAADAKAAGDRITPLESAVPGKVNKPSGDGTSGQVLKTNGDGTTSWVDQTREVTIDATLTQEGEAADAKASGDKIGTLESAVSGKVNKPSGNGTNGQILQTNGDGTTTWVDQQEVSIDATLTQQGEAADAKAAGDRIGTLESGITGKVNKPSGNGTSGQVLQTNGDGTTSWVNQTSEVTIDSTLTQQGEAADAKAAGDRIGTLESGIAGKVNKPSGNGTSGQVLQTNGDGTTSWVNQTSGVTIDATLTQQDEAADAKAAGDRISAVEGTIINKINKPSGNGTNGQVLKTNGDGTTDWVTVQGSGTVVIDDTLSIAGAAADAKAAGDLIRSKAAAIVSSVTGYDHQNVDTVIFNGNSHAWGNARYANAKNLLRLTEKSGTGGGGGVTYHSYDNIIELNGTASSGGDINAWTFTGLNIPAGVYTFKIEPYDGGTSTISGTKNMHLDFYYENASSYSVRGTVSVGTSTVSKNMTATEKVVKIVVWFGIKSGNVYDDYRLFYSLFPSETTITDTQETVSPTGTLEYELPSTMAEVDTLMHTSTVQDIVDTKTYVDSHTPDVNFVYIKPEDYGAYGDGTHDDSEALQACLTAAKKNNSNDNNFVVRGYGRYKISTGVVIQGRELNIFLKSIIYTGDDTAVSISANFSKIEFGSIRATAGGSSAKGIALVMQATAGMENGFNHSELICRYLFTNGRNLEYVDLGNGANTAYYNVFRFTYQRSVNSDLMYVPVGANINEWDIYGKTCICSNGYAFIYNDQYGATIRMHEYCFENTTKNGIYGKATLLDCRFAEMMNLKSTTDLDQGNVFVFDGISAGGFVRCEHPVDLVAIDVSNALTFDGALDKIKARFDDNPSVSNWLPWFEVLNLSNGRQFLEIQKCVRSANAHLTINGDQACIPEGKIIGYYNKIGYVPYGPIYKAIDDDFTVELTSANDYNYITPTTFDIDAASVDITLDSSYCYLGISAFDVIQHTGKTAVVYDKNNNKIFDGTNLGAGVYHFKCTMVPLTSLSITTTQGVVKNCPTKYLNAIYTGDNEQWTVTKEDLIPAPTVV